MNPAAPLRHDWTVAEVLDLYALPFADLLYRAQTAHRAHFDPNAVQVSTLLSIKTGACPEDCAYCPQSVRHDTGLERERLLAVTEVRERAAAAKAAGATRFDFQTDRVCDCNRRVIVRIGRRNVQYEVFRRRQRKQLSAAVKPATPTTARSSKRRQPRTQRPGKDRRCGKQFQPSVLTRLDRIGNRR